MMPLVNTSKTLESAYGCAGGVPRFRPAVRPADLTYQLILCSLYRLLQGRQQVEHCIAGGRMYDKVSDLLI